jgi:serine protease
MNTPKRSRSMLAVLCTTVACGTYVLAAPQIVVRRPTIPQARVPSIDVPVATPRTRPQLPSPPANAAAVQLPVIPEELVRAYIEAAQRNIDYLPGRVLVKFRDGTGVVGQNQALAAIGHGDVTAPNIEWIGDVALVRDASGTDARVLAARLETQQEVEYAQPDYLMKLDATPNDPSFGTRQWNLQNLNMPRAWDIQAGGDANLIVAVVDTGVTSIPAQNLTVQTWNGSAIVNYVMPVGPSPDFTLSRFVLPRDFTVSTTNPPSIVVDTQSHGSHVAGTIGEDTNNGVALSGIAYRVRIMPLKGCVSYWDLQFAMSAAGIPGFTPLGSGGCPTSATAAAIRFAADNGAKALNYSIGGTNPNTLARDAMAYAISKGVFIAMSNGNNFENGNPTQYPASYATSLDGAMAVAATTRIDTRSYYSSTGSWTEIAAPGGDSRQGNRIWQQTINLADASELLIFPRFDRYQEADFQGTSMASPHVAGIAALVMSQMPSLTPAQVEQLLKNTARDLGTPGRDDQFGFGIVQPRVALFGFGVRR